MEQKAQDQSKNVMIFGLSDVKTENTIDAVKPVLEIIQEKPRFVEARRHGRFVERYSQPIVLLLRKFYCCESDCVEAQIFANILWLQNCGNISPGRTEAEHQEESDIVARRKLENRGKE